jgi:cell division protein ZapD
MLPIYDGIRIVLQLLRDNGKTNHQTAGQGNFQQMLSGKVFQMLRIFVEKNLPYFPEVSANKYAINIRFVVWSGDHKPVGCESNVEFDLTLCSL